MPGTQLNLKYQQMNDQMEGCMGRADVPGERRASSVCSSSQSCSEFYSFPNALSTAHVLQGVQSMGHLLCYHLESGMKCSCQLVLRATEGE